MSEASGKDINAFMTPWLKQSGMPVIDVEQTESTVSLQQKRFVLDSDNDTSVWPVPLLADQPLSVDIFDGTEATLQKKSSKPTVINQNGSGHMLVHYTDSKTRDYIAQAFGEHTLLPETRVNMLNDQILLARGNVAPLTDALTTVNKAANEPRDAVWLIMSRVISVAMGLVEGDEKTEKNIKAFRRELASDWYKELGWSDTDSDSANTKALRQTILSLMVASEDEAAVAEALKRYKTAKTVADLPAEQRSMIISGVIRSGENVVEDLIEQYKTTPNPDVQLSICAGITNTKSTETGDYIIKHALSESGFVRPQDIFRWYAYLMRNRYTRDSAWQWLTSNWDRLEDLFGDSKSFEYFVAYSAGPINTSDWQQKFTDFFNPKSDIIALKRNIAIANSEIQTRIEWRNREEPRIRDYFA